MLDQGLSAGLQGFTSEISVSRGILLLLGFWFSYQVLLFCYRLTLHPLARFPGPKLAGASYWYEYYYNVQKKGRFIWQIKDLHQRYGPVVRVNPNELHFNDPDFYDEIYHGKKWKTNRDSWYNLNHIGEGLAFTLDHDVHLRRRNALSQYFSMQSIRALEPRITEVVATMMDRIHENKQAGNPINLYHLFSAYALDIVTQYALGKDLSMNYINNPDFGKEWADLTTGSISMNNFGRHFKGVMAFMMSLPDGLVVRMNPQVGAFLAWKARVAKQIQKMIDNEKQDKHQDEDTTIFRELLKSDLPPQDKTIRRLTDEAAMVLGAGGETTAQVLTRTVYYLIENPATAKKLRDELRSVMSEPKEISSLAVLQNLPYLNAVVDEGVRISLPVPARSPRTFQDHTLHYKEWTIRPGTAVSMSPWMVLMNERVFPEPTKFVPERWLENKELRKYQVTFSKGRRACLGINLAYAELLFAVAMIFRNFELELFETTWQDVEVVHDFFVALPRSDSKGVRVMVKSELT